MKLSDGLAVLFCSAAIVIVQPQIATGLTISEINSIAQEITVRIDGANTATGVIIERQGNTYKVLTNAHVVQQEGSYTIQTNDGQKHTIDYSRVRLLPHVDLATLQFTSSRNYRVAAQSNSDQIIEGKTVYVAGWAGRLPGIDERTYQFTNGTIRARLQNPDQGYALVYNNEAVPGMSGSPMLDENGRLIGINGRATSEKITGTILRLGIPIKTYSDFASVIPVSRTSSSNRVLTSPTPVTATSSPNRVLTSPDINNIAKQITVRINGTNTGSGVIVKQQGEIYTVLTNWHVVEKTGNYRIQTPDGKTHPFHSKPNQPILGVDLAVLQFKSSETYDIADIGNSEQINEGMIIYVAGWADQDAISTKRYYRFREGQITARLSGGKLGYNLVYSNVTKPGMSGGPVLDERGHLVGINGQALPDGRIDATDFYGIPINIYRTYAQVKE
ncbi:hypothetical protein NSTC745_01241 [Nostoc sp. DSM 114161]